MREKAKERAIALFEEYNSAPFPTCREMGVKYGVSRQRISQLVQKGERYKLLDNHNDV